MFVFLYLSIEYCMVVVYGRSWRMDQHWSVPVPWYEDRYWVSPTPCGQKLDGKQKILRPFQPLRSHFVILCKTPFHITQPVSCLPQVQIGCQSDNFRKKDVLKRAPVVCERFPVDDDIVQVWNLWGGLIYLVAPPKFQVQRGAEIVVRTAVQAPYYKSGKD